MPKPSDSNGTASQPNPSSRTSAPILIIRSWRARGETFLVRAANACAASNFAGGLVSLLNLSYHWYSGTPSYRAGNVRSTDSDCTTFVALLDWWGHQNKQQPEPRGGSTGVARLADIADPWSQEPADEPSSVTETTSLLKRAMRQIECRVEPVTWQAFWQTTVMGRSTEEIAHELELTPAAVRKANSRTLQRIRKQLGDQI